MRKLLPALKLGQYFVSAVFKSPILVPTDPEGPLEKALCYAKVINFDDHFVEFEIYFVDDGDNHDPERLRAYESVIVPISNVESIWVFEDNLLEEVDEEDDNE